MKEIKKEITKEQIVYEITKEELEAIKKEARIQGRKDIINYFSFSIKNYYYVLNIGGMQHLFEDIIYFLTRKTNTIRNSYGYSFHDYINNIEG